MQEFQSFQLAGSVGKVVVVTPGRRYVMDINGDFDTGSVTVTQGADGIFGTVLFSTMTAACVEIVTPFDHLTFTVPSGILNGVNVRIAPVTVY